MRKKIVEVKDPFELEKAVSENYKGQNTPMYFC